MPATPVDQVTLRRRGTGVLGVDHAASAGGYTLIAPQTGGGLVYLVDIDGNEVHRWMLPHRPGRHAVLLPNGNLGYNGSHPASPPLYPIWPLWHGGWFAEVTPSGEIVHLREDPYQHHDAQWLANGDILYGAVAAAPAGFGARLVGGHADYDPKDGVFYSDVIRQMDRSGRIVWEWKAWEHLDPAEYPVHPGFDRAHWPLINGVFETRDGLVLMSLRTTSGVIAVDKRTGRTVWSIRHPTVAQQHAPVELSDGRILIFDNGNVRPGIPSPFSRVIEVDPATGQITWSYADEMKPAFFTPYMGSAQRLWNGNTHITESATGRLFEVTPDGRVVWDYVIPHFAEYPDNSARFYVAGHHNSVFKTFRYRKDDIPWL